MLPMLSFHFFDTFFNALHTRLALWPCGEASEGLQKERIEPTITFIGLCFPCADDLHLSLLTLWLYTIEKWSFSLLTCLLCRQCHDRIQGHSHYGIFGCGILAGVR